MSALLAPPDLMPPTHADGQSDPVKPQRSAATAAERPILYQLALLFRAMGMTFMDIFLMIAVYAFALLLVAGVGVSARIGHAEAWAWGSRLMNLPLAVAGVGSLLVAVAAAGAALQFARSDGRRAVLAALAVSIAALLGFIATIAIDLESKWAYGVRPAAAFDPYDRYVASRFGVRLPKKSRQQTDVAQIAAAAPARRVVDALNGQKLFLGTCMTCHGARGEGMPGQGKPLIANEFVASLDDAKALQFLKVGRQPWEPLNTTKVQMPPRGGNPMLTDDDLKDIVAYMRKLHDAPKIATPASTAAGASAATPSGNTTATANASGAPTIPDSAAPIIAERWVVPPLQSGPVGLARDFVAESTRPRWQPPRDAVTFVNAYYIVTQFALIHAAVLVLVLVALLIQMWRARLAPGRRDALALAAAGCACFAMTWLLMFPFMYLF